jgi:hypothetical protein
LYPANVGNTGMRYECQICGESYHDGDRLADHITEDHQLAKTPD